jgi:hypothetical protein
MKKSAFSVLVTISTIALCLALIPNASSQIENVSILGYSYYMVSSDYLILVGEAQNTGPNVIDYIIVTGTFYAPDGTLFMSNYAKAFSAQILPQQKTPFAIGFSPSNIVSGTNWTSPDVTNFTLTVSYANPTDTRQYQDLTVISNSESSDTYGYYITGTIKNTGSQASNQTWVVATFYNSTGGVVGAGYSVILTPASIAPGGTAAFAIDEFTYYTNVADIATYSLTIQTKLTAPSTTPTPSPTPSASPTPTPSSSSPSPTPTGSGNGTAIPDGYIYAAVIAVAIVVIVAVVLVLRKRAGKRTAIPQEQAE